MSTRKSVQGVWYGIDFGTTNSSISYILPDGRVDTVDVTTGPESKIIPSAVFWRDNTDIIGQEALDASLRKVPGKALISYKPYLNTSARGVTRWIAEYVSGKPKDDFHYQCIVYKDSKTIYKLVTEKNSIQGEFPYTLKEVVDSTKAVILHLMQKAGTFLGITQPEGVVIGVPVGFSDAAKERMVAAVYDSELVRDKDKIVIVPEPLTVALQYGAEKKEESRILVFDFGGGTLDLSVVELKGELGEGNFRYRVLSKDVYNQAGSHFDRKLLNYLIEKYIPDFYHDAGINCIEELRDVTFWGVVENLKKQLSKVDSWYLTYEDYGLDENPVMVTRTDFEAAIREDLASIEQKVRELVQQAKKVMGNTGGDNIIDKVYLAGGSSLIPAVKELMHRLFPGRVRDDYAGPGKAASGYALTARYRELIEDTLDFTYGIWDYGRERIVPVLERGLPLAATTIGAQLSDGGGLEIETAGQGGATVALFAQQNERWEMTKEYQVNLPGALNKIRLFFTVSSASKQVTVEANDPNIKVKTLLPGTIASLEPGQIIKYKNGVGVEKIGCIEDIINISRGTKVEMVVGEFKRRYRFSINDPRDQSLDKQVLENEQVSVLDIKFPLIGDSIDLTRIEHMDLFKPISCQKMMYFKVLEQEGSESVSVPEQVVVGAKVSVKKEGDKIEMSKYKNYRYSTGEEQGNKAPVQRVQPTGLMEYPFANNDPVFVSIYEYFSLAAEEVRIGLAKFNEAIKLKVSEIDTTGGKEILQEPFSLQAELQDSLTVLLQLQELNEKMIRGQLLEGIRLVQKISSGLQRTIQKHYLERMKEMTLHAQEREMAERILRLPESGRKKIKDELDWLESNYCFSQACVTKEES